ncbi:MAG: hypothetical protein AB202_00315 [Parcubacteria bacterium C7867-007]|nr:MAG: hypothetical protein AB202_00315 [Parcubacteria bacterium C7867-007]
MRIMSTALVIMVSLTVGACATSPLAGYSQAPLAQNAIVGHEDCDLVTGTCKVGSNANPERLVPKLAYDTAVRYSVTCSKDVDQQVAGLLQSSAYGAGLYAVSGGLGLEGGVKYVSKTATGYGGYGAVAGGANGVVAGAMTGANSAGAAKGTCTKEKMDRVAGEFPGAIVLVVTGGKAPGANGRIKVAPATAAATTPD